MSSQNPSSNFAPEFSNSTVSPPMAQTAESTAIAPLARSGSRQPKKPLWPAIALVMVAVAGLVGWRAYQRLTLTSPSETAETRVSLARLPVRVTPASLGSVQSWVFDEGAAWPVQRRILNFQASGDVTYVTKINGVELREGDEVSQGQLLAQGKRKKKESKVCYFTATLASTFII